jgi:2-keto-4-pentenoate hydratase/2-oxohepta-3-ene-1,7-dioic acid hydratase in catechol pathway
MRIARLIYKKKEYWGIVKGSEVRLLEQPPFERVTAGHTIVPLEKTVLLAPATPSKIVLVGLNYRVHARELAMAVPQEPVIFLKPPTTLIGPGAGIIYPAGVKRLDHEAELALVVRKQAKDVPVNRACEYILGYTCLNDVTARDIQKKDGQWTRAKSFDTFCPLGPWVETGISPKALKIHCRLNGCVKQSSNTADLIFSVEQLFSFISRVMTLYPGDVISTGTPCGVGPMRRGDVVSVSIEGIGTLQNCVI